MSLHIVHASNWTDTEQCDRNCNLLVVNALHSAIKVWQNKRLLFRCKPASISWSSGWYSTSERKMIVQEQQGNMIWWRKIRTKDDWLFGCFFPFRWVAMQERALWKKKKRFLCVCRSLFSLSVSWDKMTFVARPYTCQSSEVINKIKGNRSVQHLKTVWQHTGPVTERLGCYTLHCVLLTAK